MRFNSFLSDTTLCHDSLNLFFLFWQTTAVGDCQVSYAIVRDNGQSDGEGAQQFAKVTKVINYEKCQNRPEFRQYTFNAEKCEKCQQVMCWSSPWLSGNFEQIKSKEISPYT